MGVDRSLEIKVLGLRELARGFKQIEDGLPSSLKTEFHAVAVRMVGVVQQRMPFLSGRAMRSVKARSSRSGASIAAGGRAAPYYQWLDFGGSVGRGHQPGVAWSGAIGRDWMGANVITPAGRYLYPAISEGRAATGEAALRAVGKTASRLGFTVRG